jgi:hypothetical protein
MKRIHHFQIPSKESEKITRDENIEEVKNKKNNAIERKLFGAIYKIYKHNGRRRDEIAEAK